MSIQWVPLGNVLRLADTEEPVAPESTYRMLGVLAHGRGVFLREAIRGSDTSYKALRRMSVGQIVYSRLKAFEGAFAVVSEEADGRYASSEFPSFDADQSRVDAGWLGHSLHTSWFAARVASLSRGIGARRERLGVSNFLSIEVPLPDLDTQREIAARLDSISRVSANLGTTNSANMRQARERRVLETIEGSPERAVGEVVELNRARLAITNGERYRPIGVRSFGKGLIEYPQTDADGLSKLSYFELPGDALVVSNIKAWEGAVTHYSGGKDLITSSRFLCYTAKTHDVLTAFLAEYFKSADGTAKLAAASPGSADRNRTLGRMRFEQILVPIPELEVQQALLAEIEQFSELERSYAKRRRLVGALLPAARNEEFRKLFAF